MPSASRARSGRLAHLRERRLRRDVRRARDRGLRPPPPSAFAAFGRSVIVPPARVLNPQLIEIGDGVVIHEHCWFSVVHHFDDVLPRVQIGDGVRIGRCCQLSVAGHLVIETGAIISDFVHLADTFHPPEAMERLPALVRPEPVRIGRGAVIGSHAVVLPGVTVGVGAYVDHHAVVTADVEPGAVVSGSPARAR